MTATEQPPERAEAPGLRRRVLVAVVLGLAVYAALALWADLDGLGEALRAIPWWAPLAACSLSLTNYLYLLVCAGLLCYPSSLISQKRLT